jgi:hypothetical protein
MGKGYIIAANLAGKVDNLFFFLVKLKKSAMSLSHAPVFRIQGNFKGIGSILLIISQKWLEKELQKKLYKSSQKK